MKLVLFLLALPLLAYPTTESAAQESARRATVIAGTIPHIREIAPEGARIYFEPTDYPDLEDLRILERVTGIPVGHRREVLRCSSGDHPFCRAEDHPVVLVSLRQPQFQGEDSATVEMEIIVYEPGTSAVGAGYETFLKRTGAAWTLQRVEMLWIS